VRQPTTGVDPQELARYDAPSILGKVSLTRGDGPELKLSTGSSVLHSVHESQFCLIITTNSSFAVSFSENEQYNQNSRSADKYSSMQLSGGTMSDFFQRVTEGQDVFKKLISYIPGFNGYVERQNRRAADKLMRDTVARRFEELYKRVSRLQADLAGSGGIEFVDDMEKATQQIRLFADKIRNAAYGYSGFFDAVKINEKELEQIYTYDAAFFAIADQINAALDNVEASLNNPEGLPAVIRNLVTLARQAVEGFDRRYEIINGTK
jgi:hypothetical protein